MASREKRALAPSKSKQKANENALFTESKTKKGKTILNPRHSLAREVFEAFATGSQLPPKVEANLPRKKAIQSALKLTQKIKTAKASLNKVKQKVPLKAIKKIADGKIVKKIVKNRKNKPAIKTDSKQSELEENKKVVKNHLKNNKKSQVVLTLPKIDSEEQDKVIKKTSPKINKNKGLDSPKSLKGKFNTLKKNDSRDLDDIQNKIKVEIKTEPVEHNYEITIEEVIATMLADSESCDEKEEVVEKTDNSTKKLVKSKKLKSEELAMSENDPEIVLENKIETKTSLSENLKIESSFSPETQNEENKEVVAANHVSDPESAMETENNNNSESRDRVDEAGPKLRSKTKSRSSDGEIKIDEIKVEDCKSPTPIESIEDIKSISTDDEKKDQAFPKILEKPKSRRSSLNVDVKKSVSSFLTGEKANDSAKIDLMIDKIKLSIAKSIENKLYNPEKVRKGFEPPKTSEIVAPQNIEDDKLLVTKKDIKPVEDSENSVPKVADTAKEVEKLVMGDNELVDSYIETDKDEFIERKDSEISTKEEIMKEIPVKTISSDVFPVQNELENSQKDSEMKVPGDPKKISSVRKSLRTAGKSPGFPETSSSSNVIKLKRSPLRLSPMNKIKESVKSELTNCDNDNQMAAANDSTSQQSLLKEIADILENGTTEENKVAEEKPDLQETFESISLDLEKLTAEDEPMEISSEINDVIASIDVKLEKDNQEIAESETVKLKDQDSISEVIKNNSELNNDGCDKKFASSNKETNHLNVFKEVIEKTDNVLDSKEKDIKEIKPPNEQKVGNKTAVTKKRRVFRGREKQKKVDTIKTKSEESTSELPSSDAESTHNLSGEKAHSIENVDSTEVKIKVEPNEPPEFTIRTRRSRDAKKPIQSTVKTKRLRKQDNKKQNDQQTKEETLLDNEVAKITENDMSNFVKASEEKLRGLSANGEKTDLIENLDISDSKNRSKSENDVSCTVPNLSKRKSKNNAQKNSDSMVTEVKSEVKSQKSPETITKDFDDGSTSGESLSSSGNQTKFDETPEEKARKEDILRLLGLESMEKATERINREKAKKEQYTGTLKTIIRVNKDKDKKRSRSPLKMVLKQGKTNEDSPEFYTIQKELGATNLGESSSGANRKFTTNPRYSCDEDNNDDTQPKDRQKLVIPEKSSSFSIHPERLCADVCCYCFGKFGSLDTPMHLAQIKSDDRRKKILSVERHLTKDSCLCDACYRHVDRKANTSPANIQQKPQKQYRSLMVIKCVVQNCRETSNHQIKRRWLFKAKNVLQNQIDINWEATATVFSFCNDHYQIIERSLTCVLCKRRLTRNDGYPLSQSDIIDLNSCLSSLKITLQLVPQNYTCKLCRYFTELQMKYQHSSRVPAAYRNFYKCYEGKIMNLHNVDEGRSSNTSSPTNEKTIIKNRQKSKNNTSTQPVSDGLPSKSPPMDTNENSSSAASEKSTQEPLNKVDGSNSEQETAKDSQNTSEVRYLGLESTIEKLKKRKAIDAFANESNKEAGSGGSDVVEILAMDKEITLTRLPKKSRVATDIPPVVQRLGANPSISVRTLFPGEEEMNLHANIEFGNIREVTPQGWEKCASVIQYDQDTKHLWQELMRPYGNQSSFLRHLIILEKYYRSGDLILAPNASRNAINYSTSVQNRLISYEGPEKMEETIAEPIISNEYASPGRLSGGYMVQRDKISIQPTSKPSTSSFANVTSQLSKLEPSSKVLKLTPGVSIIKKPPPNLQRLNLSQSNGSAKRKDSTPQHKTISGKVFQVADTEISKMQQQVKHLQKPQRKHNDSSNKSLSNSNTHQNLKNLQIQFDKVNVSQSQFQKHLKMQQEMLSRQSRSEFEPLVCDARGLSTNENTPTQNLINNLNLPKSIQVTTKPANPIPILPKIPKSLTVIPQTVPRKVDK